MTSSTRVKEPLCRVHIDIYGPTQTLSIGGTLYFLTFIDDYSINIWVYFVKNKPATFLRLKELRLEEETKSEKALKVLIYDQGGEYKSNDFIAFCKQQGIIM